MQTQFTAEQLRFPETAASAKIIRTCVHCGYCTATCPTFLLLGDERDSPRGRIQLIKEMLESDAAPSAETVKHIDRCLSCLSCMTTCPSGVHYMHLVDHARSHIEEKYDRPGLEKALRSFLASVLTRPLLFRSLLRLAAIGRLMRPMLPARLKSMMAMAPASLPPPGAAERPAIFPAVGPRRARVALLAGCAQSVLDPRINAAAIRLLNRLGVEVVTARGAGCCGALPHHLGKVRHSHALAKANIDAWTRELEDAGLDAIITTASGCGTSVKDYGYLFRDEPAWAERAGRISAITRDISEYLSSLNFSWPGEARRTVKVAYQSACSLQHGQNVRTQPVALLKACGFEVAEPSEAHICCGSAGTYNLLQPAIADRLRDRKIAHLEAIRPDVIASGNIGCMVQIAGKSPTPVVHTVELLDWATGGPRPQAMANPGRTIL